LKPYPAFIVIIDERARKQIIGGFKMKRTLLLLVLALCAIALISAQGNERRGQRRGPSAPREQRQDTYRRFSQSAEKTTVSGNLTLVRGMIAIKKDDVTYFAGGLNRFTRFIDGLKDGAAVTLEGMAASFPQDEKFKFMIVQKLTLNGKEYDLAPLRPNVPNAKADRGNREHRRMYQRNHHNRRYAPYGSNQRMKNRDMYRGK
jgi:uncharacterized protein YdeI (BOF family)